MELILLLCGVLFGVVFADSIGFYLSKIMSWRKSNIIGTWISDYESDGKVVNEHIEIYGSYGDVSWGMLKAQTNNDLAVEPYRIKLVREFVDVYSVVFKPQDRALAGIGAGTLVLKDSGKSANGSIVGFDFDSKQTVVRTISAKQTNSR